jgi:DNA-binding MarR family transcriptional regulator/ferritin
MRIMKDAHAVAASRFLQDVAPNRLTIVQFKALQHLHWYGGESGMTIGDLGEYLGLAHSTVSGLVDRLERDGWTVRRKCEQDRRQSRVQLTEQSRRFLQESKEAATEFWSQTIGQLTLEEQADLIKSLTRLKEVMEKPEWPSYDQLHPRTPDYLKKRLEVELEELAHEMLESVGAQYSLAQMAERQNQHELAAYLRQVASEEIRHTNRIFDLLGHGESLKTVLSDVSRHNKAMLEELLNLLDIAQAANHQESLELLQQMVQDSQRYKRWFCKMLKQLD